MVRTTSSSATLECHDLLANTRDSIELSAEGIAVADMWTYDTHTLVNSGRQELLTAFWISEHFDSQNPDTFREDDFQCGY